MVSTLPTKATTKQKQLDEQQNASGKASIGVTASLRLVMAIFIVLVMTIQGHVMMNYKLHQHNDAEEAENCARTQPIVLTPEKHKNVTLIALADDDDDDATGTQTAVVAATTLKVPQHLSTPGLINLPNHSKEVPEINPQGMIIFLLHIPKTGGTTLSLPFSNHPHWRYRMVYGWNKQARYRDEMYATLQNWVPGMKIFYEYHAGLSSPFMALQVRDDLLKFRAMAKVRKIPFFALTVLREPLNFGISFFNYYYTIRKGQDTRYFFVEHPTEHNFTELSLPNPQCLFCVHSEVAYYQSYRQAGKPIDVPRQDCHDVYDFFLDSMDWIGTTEALSTETIPLLARVANLRYPPVGDSNKMPTNTVLSKKTLSDAAMHHIRTITQFDQDMYDRAQRDFPITMWSNLDVDVPRRPFHKNSTTNLNMRDYDAPDVDGILQRKKDRAERLRRKAVKEQKE